jgi:hypothetical protein
VMGAVAAHALQVVVLAAHTNTLENLKYIKLDYLVIKCIIIK